MFVEVVVQCVCVYGKCVEVEGVVYVLFFVFDGCVDGCL